MIMVGLRQINLDNFHFSIGSWVMDGCTSSGNFKMSDI